MNRLSWLAINFLCINSVIIRLIVAALNVLGTEICKKKTFLKVKNCFASSTPKSRLTGYMKEGQGLWDLDVLYRPSLFLFPGTTFGSGQNYDLLHTDCLKLSNYVKTLPLCF